eukprot:CFRG5055T1
MSTCQKVALNYGAHAISTPIVEQASLYTRTLGEETDVVKKEMFAWVDGDGRDKRAQLSLRPEGTAGTIRAFIASGMTKTLPVRYFYQGPMFRREKPQKGRYRQFNQVGVEFIGESHALADVEAISMGYEILKRLGLGKFVQLQIHSMGSEASREAFSDKLRLFLEPVKEKLSAESQRRMSAGHYLRVLDSKHPDDHEVLENAPSLLDTASTECRAYFSKVCAGLDALEIPYTINQKLVRGLDYYRHTVWEYVAMDGYIGSQTAVMAGGRYTSLVRELGGPDLVGVGWAAGVERLELLLTEIEKDYAKNQGLLSSNSVAVCSMNGEATHLSALKLCESLRASGWRCIFNPSKNAGKQLGLAQKEDCKYSFIVGENEIKGSFVTAKNMSTGVQTEIQQTMSSEWLSEQQVLSNY